MLSIDTNILLHALNEDSPSHDTLWKHAGNVKFGFRRLYDLRTALTMMAQGVTEFATVNVKDFEGLGFRKVWSPIDRIA